MELKLKRMIVGVMVCIMGVSMPVVAKAEKIKGNKFMGKVLEVEKSEKDNTIRIKVKGYLKSCDVYEEELIAIISSDTKIMTNTCNEEKEDEKNKNKCDIKVVNIEKGDTVFICLDKAMTKSIPPQANAKRIQITKVKS